MRLTTPHSARRQAVRARNLAVVIGLAGLLPQSCVRTSHLGLFGSAHIDLDNSLRTLAQGWFNSANTVPVTIVDIDEATQAAWHHPVATPRPDLQRMIGVVEAARPAAIVVDIDVSWGGQPATTDSAGSRFRTFLEHYAGPAPLIFPKRLALGADGFRHPVANSLDDLFRSNSKLAWAHAEFVTGSGGSVRTWDEWVPVCLTDGPAWLPSVETAVALHTNPPLITLPRVSPPPLPATCASAKPVTDRLILGPRITGPERGGTGERAKAVSAAVLLDPAIARDDSSLFTNRVVLIGATHADGGDQWLTPSGVIPGVELVASTILYAPLKPDDGFLAEFWRRLGGILLFVAFAATAWFMKGAIRLVMFMVIGLGTTPIALKFGWFGFLDALESAVFLTIAYEAIRLGVDFLADLRDGWQEYGVAQHGTKTKRTRPGRVLHAIVWFVGAGLHAMKKASCRNAEPS
jgi:CHASE2 domain-containing sensor protein